MYMNDVYISKTKPDTVSYPMHCHNNWEVMYYLEGEGYMKTECGELPFKTGTIIVIPPKVMHGSQSVDGFVNISVGCDFDNVFLFDRPVSFNDACNGNGKNLALLLYNNRVGNKKFVLSLCIAYAEFIILNVGYNSYLKEAINKIIEVTSAEFCNPEFDLNALINSVGYAEDYIRSKFKCKTQMTPVEFLTKLRIKHAEKLLEIYSDEISIQTVARMSGFSDPMYFSKKFKQITGVSPMKYKNRLNKK